jgi:hypothetical protein
MAFCLFLRITDCHCYCTVCQSYVTLFISLFIIYYDVMKILRTSNWLLKVQERISVFLKGLSTMLNCVEWYA